MASSADPDQLASSAVHCLQRQGMSGFRRTRVKMLIGMANNVDLDQTAPSEAV